MSVCVVDFGMLASVVVVLEGNPFVHTHGWKGRSYGYHIPMLKDSDNHYLHFQKEVDYNKVKAVLYSGSYLAALVEHSQGEGMAFLHLS